MIKFLMPVTQFMKLFGDRTFINDLVKIEVSCVLTMEFGLWQTIMDQVIVCLLRHETKEFWSEQYPRIILLLKKVGFPAVGYFYIVSSFFPF